MGKSMEGVRHNLPLSSTSFIGREDEIAEITSLLEEPYCRLLTLVGPGGIGKTRLALEVAGGFVDPETGNAGTTLFPDGVYLVALQPVASSDDIVVTIASAIGFEFYQAQDPKAQLFRYLSKKSLLLILDNFEHLLVAVGLVSELLSEAPQINIMVTSRAALNLVQEWLYHVEGLTYPKNKSFEPLEAYGAVQLFTERARRVRRDFSLADEGAYVLQICRIVDGMPLGIELAAAWLRRLPGDEIVTEIQRSLDILETDLHGLPDRHRSMRAVLSHSWNLFGRKERDVMMKLSIFRGGFRREAAEYVASATLQNLSTLVDHSMIRLASNGRYEIHELQRQYAAERLAERPETESAIRDRHCEYFADFMDQPPINLLGERSKETIQALEADIDNIRMAWNWAVERTRIRDLHQFMETMYLFSWLRAWLQEVKRAFRQAVGALRVAEPSQERDIALGKALCFLARLDDFDGRSSQAQEKVEESLSILRRHDARRELAQATMHGAIIAICIRVNPEEAKALALEAIDLLEETGQYENLGEMFNWLGWLAQCLGQFSESERWTKKALLLGRKIGDQTIVFYNLNYLGFHALFIGEYDRAAHFLQESLAIARKREIGPGSVLPLINLGYVAMATGKIEEAKTYLQEALATARESGQVQYIADGLVAFGHFMADQGEFERATELFQEVLDTIPQNGRREDRLQALAGLGRIAFHSGEYGQARRYLEESLDLSHQFGDRRYISDNHNGLGRIALAQGETALARRHFWAALREGLAIGAPPVILDSLANAGQWFSKEGDLALAVRLETVVLNHPAAHARTREPARRLLKRLEREMSSEGFSSACERGALDELEPLAKMIAERFAALDGEVMPTSQTLLDPLSERELEILRLVAQGKSNREIAAELTLALGTVKSHLHHIFQKLDATRRTQAVVRARDHGLL